MRAVVAFETVPEVERVARAVAGELSAYVVVTVQPLEPVEQVLGRLEETIELLVVGLAAHPSWPERADGGVERLCEGLLADRAPARLALSWVGSVRALARRARPDVSPVLQGSAWNVFACERQAVPERELRRAARWGAELAHEAAPAAHLGISVPQSVRAASHADAS